MPPGPTFSGDNYAEVNATPPSRESHGTEGDIAAAMVGQKLKHDWRQEGARLYCIACPWQHGTEPRFAGYILEGTDADGLPIMRKL